MCLGYKIVGAGCSLVHHLVDHSFVFHLFKGLVLQLAHPFTAHTNLPANLLVGVLLVVTNAESHLDDGLLPFGQEGDEGTGD